MVVYFIGNDFKQKASAATGGSIARIKDDTIKQSVDGVASCELTIVYSGHADDLARVGEYIYIPAEAKNDASFFQIIEREVDYISRTVRYYADTDFMFFSSQVANDGTYGRVSSVGQSILWYLDEFRQSAAPFHFMVDDYELAGRTAIGDTNASTAKEALQKTADLFNAEIRFDFQFEGGIIQPYMNIYEKGSGANENETLLVGKDVTELIENTDCADVATAVKIRGAVKAEKTYTLVSDVTSDEELEVGAVIIVGGVPYKVYNLRSVTSQAQMTDPETVYYISGSGYYFGSRSSSKTAATGWACQNGFAARLTSSTVGQDDYVITNIPDYNSGDYFSKGDKLFCRSAWYRFGAPESGKRENVRFGADIFLQGNDLETTDPQQVLDAGIALLEQHKEPTVSYSCKCRRAVTIGAYYTIIVPDEHIYIQVRCIETEKSQMRGEFTPTFGNFKVTNNAFEIMAKNAK